MFAVAGPMLVVVGLTHNRDVIFPEGAALALGVVALRLPDWSRSPIRLAVIPPACATIGIALTHADLPRWGGELAAITAAFVLLHLGRSRLTPSLSAGAFPLVFDVHTWAYPLTVLAVCVALAAITTFRPSRPSPEPVGRLPIPVAGTTWAVTAAWIVLAGPVLSLGAATVAPPLVVAMVERFATGDRSALTGLRHWAVIVAAAAAGAFAAADITPRWTGGLLAVAAVLVAFAVLSGPHPPALAICLIPQVAIAHHPGAYVADIAAGAAALYLAAGIAAHTPLTRPTAPEP